MAGRSDAQPTSFPNSNQKQAARWKYEVHTHCALVHAEDLLETKPKEGWELVSLSSFSDPRLSSSDVTMGDGTLRLNYTLTFRRDESRTLETVSEHNVHVFTGPKRDDD